MQPVSFTCEHIETLMELDIELREDAHKAGIGHYQRGAALNLDETWLHSLAHGAGRPRLRTGGAPPMPERRQQRVAVVAGGVAGLATAVEPAGPGGRARAWTCR